MSSAWQILLGIAPHSTPILPLSPCPPASSNNVQCTLTASLGSHVEKEEREGTGGEGRERIGWTGDSKIWSNQMNNAEVATTENTHNNAINNKSGRLQEKWCEGRGRGRGRSGCRVGVADWLAMVGWLCFNACAAANASVSVLNSFIVIYSTVATTTATTMSKSNQRNYNSVKSALIKGQQQQQQQQEGAI